VKNGKATVIGPEVIEALLPHRSPLLLVERVTGLTLGGRPRIVAELELTGREPVFAGHFPGRPIWPGAYGLEGLAQAGGLLVALILIKEATGTDPLIAIATQERPVGMPMAGTMGSAQIKFRAPIEPPARIEYRVHSRGAFGPLHRLEGEIVIAGRCHASGEFALAVDRGEGP
jgi:3-hydroxyacyl-[acyl-carrier-protein] dehydratase